MPLRKSRSRKPDTGVSMVTTSAEKPALPGALDAGERHVASAD